MTLHDPVFAQDLTYSADEVRQALIGAIGDSGVIGIPSLKVTQRAAGANMSVDIAAGRAIVPGPSGGYICRSDAIESRVVTAAPSSGNGRIDLVVARIRDAQATGVGSEVDWVIEVIAGTPAANPDPPAVPSYAIELARITLTDATTSIVDGIITDTRRHSASLADRHWPLIRADVMDGTVVQGTGVVDYGSVVIPAPNRLVKLRAWIGCTVHAVSPDENTVSTLALRATFGSTALFTNPVTEMSVTEFHPHTLSRTMFEAIEPGPGEDITVVGRIQTVTGGDAAFVDGHLMVEVDAG